MNKIISTVSPPLPIPFPPFPIKKMTSWQFFDTLRVVQTVMYDESMCKMCSQILKISDDGFMTCPQCGFLHTEITDDKAEWRVYDDTSNDLSRCGIPINPLLCDSSFGCRIVCIGNVSYNMRRIRKYSDWHAMSYKDKMLSEDFARITSIAQNAGIPKLIIDGAVRYHKLISEHSITFRGSNRDGILAASIYISCRVNEYPRTPREIATMFFLDPTSATKGCKNALTILNDIEKNLTYDEKTVYFNPTPVSFTDRFCSRLNMTSENMSLCKFISMKIDNENYIPENTPQSIAAGVIFFVSRLFSLSITKRDVNIVSEISEVTISKCYKKICKIDKRLLIPNILLQKL